MRKQLLKFLAKKSYAISPKLYVLLSYFHNRGKFPNLKKPHNISEIILSQIVTGEINKYADYVDKVKVRDYLIKWGFEEFLPKIYGIWNNVDEIDFGELPQQFALKTNNGCGSNYFCKDKSKLDIVKAKKILRDALQKKIGLTETQYHYISPCVYCEEFIDDGKGDLPLDYKFMCCDGEIKCILLCSERSTGLRLSTYDLEWNELDYPRNFKKSKLRFEQPKNLDKMTQIAQIIAQKFVAVRVDLYDTGDKVYIGELTFTPEAGIMSYFKNRAIDFMGHSNK